MNHNFKVGDIVMFKNHNKVANCWKGEIGIIESIEYRNYPSGIRPYIVIVPYKDIPTKIGNIGLSSTDFDCLAKLDENKNLNKISKLVHI